MQIAALRPVRLLMDMGVLGACHLLIDMAFHILMQWLAQLQRQGGDAAMPELAARLESWCEQRRYIVLADQSVRPEVAAILVARSPRTLQNWRDAGDTRLRWHRGGGTLRYRL